MELYGDFDLICKKLLHEEFISQIRERLAGKFIHTIQNGILNIKTLDKGVLKKFLVDLIQIITHQMLFNFLHQKL
jgi:hypothetical protein